MKLSKTKLNKIETITLSILTGVVVILSAVMAFAYCKNLDQNAFAPCELVVCAYCTLSIYLIFRTLINTNQLNSYAKTNKLASQTNDVAASQNDETADDDMITVNRNLIAIPIAVVIAIVAFSVLAL